MKKTLLIAAAALAAGVISSQAQSVYSQNVVGYVNVTVPAHGLNLLANQLLFVGPNGTNSINDVLVNGNFVSGGTGATPVASQTLLYYWNGAAYNTYFYWSSNDLTTLNGSYYGPNGWYDAGFSLINSNLNQGSGCFISNPSSTVLTNTFVGTVAAGTYTNVIAHGFNPVSTIVPLGLVSFDSTNYSLPSYGDDGSETAYLWNGSSYNNVFWWSAAYLSGLDPNYVADGYKPGWYDAGGVDHSYNATNNDTIWAITGQGSFLYYTGPTTNWVSTFNVQ